VAWEIHETLPRWEAAAYLTDPGLIPSQARFRSGVLWALVSILFVSIAAGGTLVLATLHGEMTLARQKTSFVAGVSHELKTPLTSIRMFAEMLKEGRQPDRKKRAQYLELMLSETERLSRLIGNVLDFSRLEQGQRSYRKRRLDAVALCSTLVESRRLRLEQKGFALSVRLPEAALAVEADEEALKQVLLNLLSNAENYSLAARSTARRSSRSSTASTTP